MTLSEKNFLAGAAELISDLKAHIIQEHAQDPWLLVNRESYLYYRHYAVSQNKSPVATPSVSIPQKKETIVIPEKKPTQPISSEAKTKVIIETPPKELLEPAKTNPVEKAPVTKTIETEQLKPVVKDDFSDIKKIMQERFPEQQLLAQPPEDSLAKQIKNGWKTIKAETNLFLIISDVKPHQSRLLENIVFAIRTVFKLNVAVVKKKEMGQSSGKMLEVPDLEMLLNVPAQKAALWKEITKVCGAGA